MRIRIKALIIALKDSIADRRIRSGLLWNLLATVAGRSSGLIISVILSRMLGKELFGEFSMIQNTVLTLGVFAGLGTGLTATKYIAETFRTDHQRAGRMLALTMLMSIVFGCLITAVTLAGAPLIAGNALSAPHLTALLQLSAASLAASAICGAQNGILAGFEQFRALSALTILTGIANIVGAFIGVVYWSLNGAVIGYTLATLFSAVMGSYTVRKVCREKSISPDFRNCTDELSVIWSFSLPAMLSNILVMPVSWVCNAMLVNQHSGFIEMGIYNIVTQWRQLILFLPGVAAQVFLPVMTSSRGEHESLSTEMTFLKVNLLFTLPIMTLLTLSSPLILSLYGSSYAVQWPVFVIVQLATLAQVIQSPVVTSWAASGRMWTNLGANMFWGSSLLFFSWLFIDRGALGLSLALLISFLIYFPVIFIIKRTKVISNAAAY